MSVAPQAMARGLRKPWHSLHRERQGASFGMWLFLSSEAMFFGAALMAFAVYRGLYPEAFAEAAKETNIWYGSFNTAILLTSSLTMAVAAEGAQAGLRRLALRCLCLTMVFGIAFMVLKGLEYYEDVQENLIPGSGFKLDDDPAAQIFFAFYWVLTGVHAVHLTVGITAVAVLTWQGWRGTRELVNPGYEALALYWHLVDIIWVFLYPLIYLPGRAT